MSNLTDAEISRRLAVAIGWLNVSIHKLTDSVWVSSKTEGPETFDYRDPAVIWPIAEQYNKWPRKEGNEWKCDPTLTETVSADTAAKAVALAVIKAKEQQ